MSKTQSPKAYRSEASAAIDHLNQRILTALQTRGIAVPSQTVLGGRFAIRVCITNHRSRDADFDALLAAVATLGDEFLGEAVGG